MFDTSYSGRTEPAVYVDDRTQEQRATHTIIVWGRDRFMSGWGQARGGYSWAGWACEPKDADRVESWSELEVIRTTSGPVATDHAGAMWRTFTLTSSGLSIGRCHDDDRHQGARQDAAAHAIRDLNLGPDGRPEKS